MSGWACRVSEGEKEYARVATQLAAFNLILTLLKTKLTNELFVERKFYKHEFIIRG